MLALRDVTCVRGGRDLFTGLSLELKAGDAALVTGPNGAGKSTLIWIAAGLLAPSAGSVSAIAARALLGEACALDGERTLRAALAFWAALDDAADPDGRVARGLAAMDLAPLAATPVRLLSTGQRRRAAIARVIASAAPIWLLDEPLNGLDAAATTRLEAAIAAHRAKGGTALLATHTALALPGSQAVKL